jgi:hypothetical protein
VSTTGISGSSVPGFDVLFPSGETATASTPSASTTSENVYQQAADSLQSWQYSFLYQSIQGTGPSTLPLYTDGQSTDSFASLATQLGAIEAQQQQTTPNADSTLAGILGSNIDQTV